MNVTDLKKGEEAKVLGLELTADLRERLKMLNVYAGAGVRLVKVAPFGAGYLLSAGSIRLAVGKSIAQNIFVEREEQK